MDHSPRFLRLVEQSRTGVREVTVDDVARRLEADESFVLIDVREDHEWTKGHLPKARHLGRGVLERDVELAFPDVQTDIVLYCGGGYRSALAAESLQRMGYQRVSSMWGGFRGWVTSGRPIERTEEQR